MGKTFNIINIILLIITIIMLDIVAVNYESKIKHKSVLEQTYENMNNLDNYKIKYILNNDPNEYIYSFDTFNLFIKEEKINKKNKENNINYYIKFKVICQISIVNYLLLLDILLYLLNMLQINSMIS